MRARTRSRRTSRLGFKPDLRDYGIGAQVLVDLGVKRLLYMTNNPAKLAGLEGYGLEIVDRIPLHSPPNDSNRRYMETKRTKMGHLLAEDLPAPLDEQDGPEAA